MTPEEELGKTLDQLIYKYDACGSRVADLLRELKEKRARIEAQEDTIKKLREALAECIEYATSTTVVEEVARAALADTGSKI